MNKEKHLVESRYGKGDGITPSPMALMPLAIADPVFPATIDAPFQYFQIIGMDFPNKVDQGVVLDGNVFGVVDTRLGSKLLDTLKPLVEYETNRRNAELWLAHQWHGCLSRRVDDAMLDGLDTRLCASLLFVGGDRSVPYHKSVGPRRAT